MVMGYIDSQGNYYEGDRQGDDQSVPQRPSSMHDWDGSAWVENRERKAAAIQAEIDRLERESLMNRGVRELSLRQMEFMAGQLAEDLETIPAYVKFKALDDQITELRGQIWLLSEQS
jgi:hypothetical protein